MVDNKISKIKDRVILIAEKQIITKESFYKSIGVTSANFRGKPKETPLNSKVIVNIITTYPDIDPIWLLTGQGEMLKKVELSPQKRTEGYVINSQAPPQVNEPTGNYHANQKRNPFEEQATIAGENLPSSLDSTSGAENPCAGLEATLKVLKKDHVKVQAENKELHAKSLSDDTLIASLNVTIAVLQSSLMDKDSIIAAIKAKTDLQLAEKSAALIEKERLIKTLKKELEATLKKYLLPVVQEDGTHDSALQEKSDTTTTSKKVKDKCNN